MYNFFVTSILPFFLTALPASAQSMPTQIPMADGLRSEGKIYVVVLSLLLILGGIFTFLFWLERRLSKLEKQSNEN